MTSGLLKSLRSVPKTSMKNWANITLFENNNIILWSLTETQKVLVTITDLLVRPLYGSRPVSFYITKVPKIGYHAQDGHVGNLLKTRGNYLFLGLKPKGKLGTLVTFPIFWISWINILSETLLKTTIEHYFQRYPSDHKHSKCTRIREGRAWPNCSDLHNSSSFSTSVNWANSAG